LTHPQNIDGVASIRTWGFVEDLIDMADMGVGQKSGSTRWKPEVLVILGMNDPILRVIHQV